MQFYRAVSIIPKIYPNFTSKNISQEKSYHLQRFPRSWDKTPSLAALLQQYYINISMLPYSNIFYLFNFWKKHTKIFMTYRPRYQGTQELYPGLIAQVTQDQTSCVHFEIPNDTNHFSRHQN